MNPWYRWISNPAGHDAWPSSLQGRAYIASGGRIVAFDPLHLAWERRQKNVRSNDFGQVLALKAAPTLAVPGAKPHPAGRGRS